MNYHLDTCILLEILLQQQKKEKCKEFINNNDLLFISDFSFHSIGVTLFRTKYFDKYISFVNDVAPRITITSLSQNEYQNIPSISKKYNFDFDDSYQFALSKTNEFNFVTLDAHFNQANNDIKITFL